ILLRMPLPQEPESEIPPDPEAGRRIAQVAADLLRLERKRAAGEKVPTRAVLDRLRVMERLHPVDFGTARVMVRSLAARPVARSRGVILGAAETLTPRMVRRSILVALRDVACGDPDLEDRGPDAHPLVREEAARVLARIGSPVARRAAIRRLESPFDPAEREVDVRRHLVSYLGRVGSPEAFETCLRRLEDIRYGIRYHAHRALAEMTGAAVPPVAQKWREWRDAHPTWQAPPAEPAGSA
ncbi:MAG: HEAT repeat domain-containing protein, partial [Planctomycetota bacterium]